MAFQQVTVPYFDLGLYGLQSGYFRSETYGPQNPNDQMGGSALSAGHQRHGLRQDHRPAPDDLYA